MGALPWPGEFPGWRPRVKHVLVRSPANGQHQEPYHGRLADETQVSVRFGCGSDRVEGDVRPQPGDGVELAREAKEFLQGELERLEGFALRPCAIERTGSRTETPGVME